MVIAVSRHASNNNALLTLQRTYPNTLHCRDADVTDDQQVASLANDCSHIADHIDTLINCAGVLHDHSSGLAPEKRLEHITSDALLHNFAVNAMAPILLAKHFIPLLKQPFPTKFASLSARVGSISDNQLGGWYSYRASKAAQNQLLKTLANETRHRARNLIVLSLHPGTTDTPLSQPFQRNVPDNKLFTADYAAGCLLDIIDRATRDDHGTFIAWDGQTIPW